MNRSNLTADRYLYLNEAKGIPDVVKNLTDLTYRKFLNYPKNEIIRNNDESRYSITIDNNEVKFPFFKRLFIFINITKDRSKSSYYKHLLSNWNENDKIFERVVINIFLLAEDINDLKQTIAHELTHAYEDYKRKFNSNKSFQDLNQNIVSTETDELLAIKNKFEDNQKLNVLSYYIYYLLNVEKNANVSQLYYELKKYGLTKNDINNSEYQKLSFYKIYQNINKYAESYINSLSDDELNLFGEYIQHSSINRLFSNDKNVFKRNLINYFKTESAQTLKKMRKIMAEYLTDDDLMEIFHSDKNRMFEIMKHLDKLSNLL